MTQPGNCAFHNIFPSFETINGNKWGLKREARPGLSGRGTFSATTKFTSRGKQNKLFTFKVNGRRDLQKVTWRMHYSRKALAWYIAGPVYGRHRPTSVAIWQKWFTQGTKEMWRLNWVIRPVWGFARGSDILHEKNEAFSFARDTYHHTDDDNSIK